MRSIQMFHSFTPRRLRHTPTHLRRWPFLVTTLLPSSCLTLVCLSLVSRRLHWWIVQAPICKIWTNTLLLWITDSISFRLALRFLLTFATPISPSLPFLPEILWVGRSSNLGLMPLSFPLNMTPLSSSLQLGIVGILSIPQSKPECLLRLPPFFLSLSDL